MTKIPKPPQKIHDLLQQILRAKCPDFITKFYKEKFSKHGHEIRTLRLVNEKLYRIVEMEESIQSHIKQISYPPNPPLGRCNKKGKPVFYCSESKTAPLYEIKDLKVGQSFIVGEWQIRKPICVIAIGSDKSFKDLSSERSMDFHIKRSSRNTFDAKTNRKIFEFLCKIFTKNFYEQSAGISEFLMNHPNQIIGEKIKEELKDIYHLNGIQYPAVRVKGNVDNFALPKCFIDSNGLELIRCELIRVIEVSKEGIIKLETFDYATDFSNYEIAWKKSVPKDWMVKEEFFFSKTK